MRSAPTLKIWITPFASVAMLEKFALLKMALWSALALRSVSCRRPSVRASAAPGGSWRAGTAGSPVAMGRFGPGEREAGIGEPDRTALHGISARAVPLTVR